LSVVLSWHGSGVSTELFKFSFFLSTLEQWIPIETTDLVLWNIPIVDHDLFFFNLCITT